jgi:hypothetical protein
VGENRENRSFDRDCFAGLGRNHFHVCRTFSCGSGRGRIGALVGRGYRRSTSQVHSDHGIFAFGKSLSPASMKRGSTILFYEVASSTPEESEVSIEMILPVILDPGRMTEAH